MTHCTSFWAAVAVAASISIPAQAATIIDPIGDFDSRIGPRPGFDLTSLTVTFDGTDFFLTATTAGNIQVLQGENFIFAINTGSGISHVGSQRGSVFDSAIVVRIEEESIHQVADLDQGADSTAITPFILDGSSLSGHIAASLLPGSNGLTPQDFEFSVFTQLEVDGTPTLQVDFAPDDTHGITVGIATVAEPGTWAMMLAGVGSLGALRRWPARRNGQAAE